ncbi:anti-sigma factor [Paenibacillus sp. S150]|uniref:anti-sigma factor n=1 Tax=Paenibacillus sp. S150 TaxID=2749826 RepID=UPI001C59BD04|nr:anti-sigma factor [Paenibacillus sp. S150]MBW4083305.1 anti sigma factor C-terminal domain-containing protein [Paenibacillus sp. S150]
MTAPWEEAEEQNLVNILKKTKRKSMIRSIIISLTVSILTLIGIFVGASQLVDRRSSETLFSEWNFMMISSPNEYESGYKDNRGFLSGVMELNTYKIVENVPIPWHNKWINYNEWWFPFTTGTYGGTSNLTVEDSNMKQEGYEYYRNYNPYNGQREMAYYIPEVDYNGKILNDLSLLDRMEEEKLVEMAISFNTSYSFAEVKTMLPAGISPVWYWVDTYADRSGFNFKPYRDGNGNMSYPLPMTSSFGVYGFGIRPDSDQAAPEDFIDLVKSGIERKDKYNSEYRRIYNDLKKDETEPEAADLRILGVVVTGTADGLKSFKNQSYVRAAVLGAVVDKY